MPTANIPGFPGAEMLGIIRAALTPANSFPNCDCYLAVILSCSAPSPHHTDISGSFIVHSFVLSFVPHKYWLLSGGFQFFSLFFLFPTGPIYCFFFFWWLKFPQIQNRAALFSLSIFLVFCKCGCLFSICAFFLLTPIGGLPPGPQKKTPTF